MGAPARSWDHPRWRYDEDPSPAARRSAARAASRTQEEWAPRSEVVLEPAVRPPLRVVRAPRLRVGSILLIAGFLGAALAAPVGVNLAVVRGQWQIAELSQKQDDAVAVRSTLRAEQAALSSTQRVKETADRLGMVTPTAVGFIHLGGAANGRGGSAAFDGGHGSVAVGADAAGVEGLTLASASQEAGAGR